ncbi:MAG: protein kinase [Myxococcota bacterium]
MTVDDDTQLSDDEIVALLDGTASIDDHLDRLDRCDQSRELLALARALGPSRPSNTFEIGRYEVRELLGEGGMGVVYRAWDPDIHREVALKVWASTSAPTRERLLHEARVMGRLSHPGLATILDAGHDERFGTFLAVALVEGETLRRWARGPTTAEARLSVLLQVAEAVAVAHDAGVAHGDLKPENVLVRPSGAAVVADFGLALLDGAGPRGGTRGYVAPEQLERGASAKADQYAFCTMARGLELPRRFDSIWLRGVQAEPHARWPDMHALRDAVLQRRARGPRILLGAGAAVAALALGGVAARDDAEACPLQPEAVSSRWSSLRAASALDARSVASLDDYVTRWVEAAQHSCETEVGQPCLLRARVELSPLLEQLESAAAVDVVPWVASLSQPHACFDVASTPAPSSGLAEARALRLQGNPREAARVAGRIAVRTDDPELAAEAELLRGKALAGIDEDAALDSLWRASVAATSTHRPDLEAESLLGLAMVEARLPRRTQDAARLLERAEGLIARHTLPLRPPLAYMKGVVASAQGDRTGALDAFARADALAHQELPSGHPFRLQYALEHATALARLSRYNAAIRRLETLREHAHTALGPAHPRTAAIDAELGSQLANAGRLADAQLQLESALTRLETALGSDAALVLDNRRNLAIVLEELEQYEDAQAIFLSLHDDNDRVGRRGPAFAALCSAGDVDFETNADESARERYAKAIDYARRHDLRDIGGCVARLGAAQAALGLDEARATLQQAVTLTDGPGADPLDASFARFELARIVDDQNDARTLALRALDVLPDEGAVAKRRRDDINRWLER